MGNCHSIESALRGLPFIKKFRSEPGSGLTDCAGDSGTESGAIGLGVVGVCVAIPEHVVDHVSVSFVSDPLALWLSHPRANHRVAHCDPDRGRCRLEP
jgi:hypothetical protein